MSERKSIRIDKGIKNPCYDEKTQTDCPRRAVGCHEKCNLYKIYKTLKAVERKQRQKKTAAAVMMNEYESRKSKRINGMRNKK